MKTSQIEPFFGYRFSQAEIRSTYKSASDAFESGDYLNAAQMADDDDELRGCALILSGLTEAGLTALGTANNLGERGLICQAFALWILERDREAIASLGNAVDRFQSSKANTFLNLLQRDEIIAFITSGMLPLHAEEGDAAREPIHKYGPIVAKYVGSQMPKNAYDYCSADPLDLFIANLPESEKPDFIFALSPQWIIPKNFKEVTVPKVLWAHDGDVFLFRNVDNFSLYDVTICECSQLHFELSNSTSSPCVSNIIFHPLASSFPEAPINAERDIDILFTGSSFTQFHSEKPRFIYRLSELGEEYRVKVVDGHLPEKDYFELLARARFVPLLNRYAGAPSPRWRDALTSGAGIFYPEGAFYDLIAPGCFPIHDDSMIEDMRAHLRCATSGDAAYDNDRIARNVNTRFATYRRPREKLFEWLLKYAAFMALVWKGHRLKQPAQDRRLVWLTPQTDAHIFGSSNILRHLTEIVSRIDTSELQDEIDYNNAARLHMQLVYCFGWDPRITQWRSTAHRYFADGLRRFPDSLLLRFNAACWQFFDLNHDGNALIAKFQNIIDEFDSLRFDFRGSDVGLAYTRGSLDLVFPYYEYADLVTREMVLTNRPELAKKHLLARSSRDAIVAACRGYIGMLLEEQGRLNDALVSFEVALALFPNNLPLSLVRFDKLLDCCEKKAEESNKFAAKLAEACFTTANAFPTILLTHAHRFIPILVRNGQGEAARMLLAAWYRLQNVVYEPQVGKAEYRQFYKLAILSRYHALFPEHLSERLRAARLWKLTYSDLTQIEQLMFDLSGLSVTNISRQLRARLKLSGIQLTNYINAIRHFAHRILVVTCYLWSDIRNPPNPQHSSLHRFIHVVLRSTFYLPVYRLIAAASKILD